MFSLNVSTANARDQDSPTLDDFVAWMKKFGKKYETDIILKGKFSSFISNHFRVKELNKLHK